MSNANLVNLYTNKNEACVDNTIKEYIKIRCPNILCLYEWKYRGRFRFYATCTSCRRNVRISENKVGVTAI
jgi:hypothetical protein